MKLFCFSIGIIFFHDFTIIWAFTAFWTINRREMARFLELQKKSQNFIEITSFKENITSDIWNFGQFWLNQCWFPKCCHFVAIYFSESCNIMKKRMQIDKKYDFIDFLIKLYFIDFLSKYTQKCHENRMSDPKKCSVKCFNF